MRHPMIKHLLLAALNATVLLTAVACREPAQTAAQAPDSALISGTVSYRERIALTDRAELTVTLADVSRQDVAARVIAEQKIPDPGQVPIRFEMEYPTAEIDDRMSYALRATIHDRGRMLFTTDTHVPVLTRGAGREARLVLVAVTQAAAEAEGIGLEGMFRYLADAALFRDCRTNRVFPVAMEGCYIELERAYLDSGIEAGKEIMVRLQGRYLERPAMEGNNKEIKLIVDKVEKLDPEKTCTPTAHAELQNTYWKVVELDGGAVETPEGMREAHVILASEDSRAHGHAGCNNFFGHFETAGEKLSFSALGSTMMACPEGMDTEQAFLQALGETTRYEISGQFLTLYANDRPLARLEAVYL